MIVNCRKRATITTIETTIKNAIDSQEMLFSTLPHRCNAIHTFSQLIACKYLNRIPGSFFLLLLFLASCWIKMYRLWHHNGTHRHTRTVLTILLLLIRRFNKGNQCHLLRFATWMCVPLTTLCLYFFYFYFQHCFLSRWNIYSYIVSNVCFFLWVQFLYNFFFVDSLPKHCY